MVFNTGAALLDAIVLAVVSKEPEGTYGYKITVDVTDGITRSPAEDGLSCSSTKVSGGNMQIR